MEMGWAWCESDLNFTKKSVVSWGEVCCVESQHGFEADGKQWHFWDECKQGSVDWLPYSCQIVIWNDHGGV